MNREQIRSAVVVDERGCWLWQLTLNPDGYGVVPIYRDQRRTTIGAHRLSYQAFVGTIPTGLDIDHLCRVRGCVNPDHLEPVTRAENLRRAARHRRYVKAMDAIHEAAQDVVDGAIGTPDGVLVPLHLLDALAQAVDAADATQNPPLGAASPRTGAERGSTTGGAR